MRKFAKCNGYEDAIIPVRATATSAGYDFCTINDVAVPAGGIAKVVTGIKAYMEKDEVLLLYVRSSVGIKHGIGLANGTGVIDSDYCDNPDNEGNIIIALRNYSDVGYHFPAGSKIAQGVFVKYLTVDEDATTAERVGGIGSTGK